MHLIFHVRSIDLLWEGTSFTAEGKPKEKPSTPAGRGGSLSLEGVKRQPSSHPLY